jgi:hypothetical protein
MKKNFTLIPCLALCLTIFSLNANAQCASTAYVSSGGNCISLSWSPAGSIPNPLPSNIVLNGTVYAYFSGVGDVGFPAVYQSTTDPCQAPSDYVDGNITFNFLAGTSFTCQYPNGTLLALQNVQLKAYKKQDQTMLEWSADTKDINSFEVQRSNDGKNFRTIASVAVNQHSGIFTYADGSVSKEQYYRLRVVESNNMGWYSKVVRVGHSLNEQISVYPNPAKGTFVLSGMNSTSLRSLAIYDAQGRKVAFQKSQLSSDGSSARITLATNSKGMIFLSWNDGSTKGVLKTTIE